MNKVILVTGIVSFLFSGIWGCKAKKEAVKDYSQPPSWVSERPVNQGYYYGIGSAPKRGSAQIYRQRAAEKALSDIAAQIATHVKSKASMYRVEDKYGIREIYESQIKTQSEDFLEGQEVIDEYQNEDYYYVLYRLSAQTYEQKRNARKQGAFDAAEQFYLSGIKKAEEGEYQLSVHYLLKAIEIIYPFRGEETLVTNNQDTLDLFAGPLEKIKSIAHQLEISASAAQVKVSGDYFDGAEITYMVHDNLKRAVSEAPILFSVDGGYLISNRAKTDSSGKCTAPSIQISDKRNHTQLSASIDLSQWVNQGTEIMEIRNLIKQWTESSCEVKLVN
ncbi:LPP20 family lipoprotein [Marinilabilia rubra]|nr:LPP20 family lipoprotein [Marinilabilia rubra]